MAEMSKIEWNQTIDKFQENDKKLKGEDMTGLPWENIRIIDFGWVLACPHGTRLLADLGAQVIKVESRTKLDGLRVDFPREGVTNPLDEGGGQFNEQN